MLTSSLRADIDKIWNTFWTGGLSNPLTVIEQITYLLFIKRLDELQTLKESQSALLGTPVENTIYTTAQKELRWSTFKDMAPEAMHKLFTKEDGVFDFMRNYGAIDSAFGRFMKGAVFMIPTPRLLSNVVDMISGIDMKDRDTKGDVYEYLLSKIATAGQNGQFRTPRHIIKMMVDMMQPTIDDTICDPSAGTCGFLVGSAEYLREHEHKAFYDKSFTEHFNKHMFMQITPKSPIGKALVYSIERWNKLSLYTQYGMLNIDNNPVENSIRPVALGRKNYLFAGSHEAARRSGMLYSLLGTCKMHGIEPYT